MLAAAGPFGLGPMELVIILLVLVMLFGATRLKDLGGSLGQGIKEFRNAVKEDEEEVGKPHPTPGNGDSHATLMAEGKPLPPTNGDAHAPSAGGPEVVAAVKCPSCGSLNAQGAKFCSSCGASITAPVS